MTATFGGFHELTTITTPRPHRDPTRLKTSVLPDLLPFLSIATLHPQHLSPQVGSLSPSTTPMAASEIIGDVTHLHRNRVPFSAVHTATGSCGDGDFLISEARGFRQLVVSRAYVRIDPASLQCQVIGPASATIAVTAHIAVIPSAHRDLPDSAPDLLTIAGGAFVQHSLFTGSEVRPLGFAVEVSHVLKPKPVIGTEPRVVFHYTASGASATSQVHIKISGFLEVDGIGFVQTWA